MKPGLGLRLLQAPALIGGDGVARPLSAGDAALLAHLALYGPSTRNTLAALRWPDRPLAKAQNNLRQRLFRLQQLAADPLLTDGPLVALAPGVTHDLLSPLPALRADPDALAGPLLGTLDYGGSPELAAWVDQQRQRWREMLRDAMVQLALDAEAGGRLAEAIRHGERLVRDEPLFEHGVRLLMRLHHRRGDRGAALAVFERCVATLHQQLGDAVSDETAALAQAIGAGSAAAPTPIAPLPIALRHPPRLAGRHDVLAEAERRWQRSGLVLVCGPPGIGKSRVFDELCQRWGLAHAVRLPPDAGQRPFGLLHALAAALRGVAVFERACRDDPLLAWLADPQRAPPGRVHAEQLARALREALARWGAGGNAALAVDDLQFADPDSLLALSRLLPPAHDAPPLRWLLASRDAPLPPPLPDWLARLADADDPQVVLPPLEGAALEEFVATVGAPGIDVPAWTARLHAHCGGHPLSLLQVLRALHDGGQYGRPQPPAQLPLPEQTRRRVARCLEGSDAAAQQLAFVAALASAEFDAELACRVLQCRATELAVPWRRLEALGVLRGSGFSHELIRQAVLEAVPQALLPAMRRDLAVALRAAGRAPASRVPHWEAAGAWAEAADDARAVAERIQSLGLPTQARPWLQRAAAASERAGDAAAAFVLRWRDGQLALACDSADEALVIARRLLDDARGDAQCCRALCLRAQVRSEQHDRGAADDAAQALALADATGQPELMAAARLRHAGALQMLGQLEEAERVLAALRRELHVLPAAERDEVNDLAGLVLAQLGRRRDALALCEAEFERAQRAGGDLPRAATLAGQAAVHLGYLCRTRETVEAGRRALALARQTGQDHGYVHVDEMTLAGSLADDGQYDEALQLGERAADALHAAGLVGWALNADNSLAGMFAQLGRFDLALQRLPDAPADAPMWSRAARIAMQATVHQQADGRPPLARLRQAYTLFDEGGALVTPFIRYRIELLLARWSGPEAAARGAAECQAWAQAHEHVALARHAGMVRIEALLAAGRTAEARRVADAIEAECDGNWQANNFYLPELWLMLVRAHDAAGETRHRRRADALTRLALEWIDDRARHHMAPHFQESFLTRNPVNRALRERAPVTKR